MYFELICPTMRGLLIMKRYQVVYKFLDVVAVQQPSLIALAKWIADNCHTKDGCLYVNGDSEEVYIREL